MEDDIAIRNEVPHQERIGYISEPYFQTGTLALRYVSQVPNLAAAVVPRQRTNLMTFPEQQLRNVAANEAAGACDQNSMAFCHLACGMLRAPRSCSVLQYKEILFRSLDVPRILSRRSRLKRGSDRTIQCVLK
jgi:hypothetical protein